MKWFVYPMSPIDFWNGWRSTLEIVQEFRQMGDEDAVGAFIREVGSAVDAAVAAGYDGTPRESIHVSPLPRSDRETYGYPRWMFGIKQDNNGTTFIVSPYPLIWLGESHEVTLP